MHAAPTREEGDVVVAQVKVGVRLGAVDGSPVVCEVGVEGLQGEGGGGPVPAAQRGGGALGTRVQEEAAAALEGLALTSPARLPSWVSSNHSRAKHRPVAAAGSVGGHVLHSQECSRGWRICYGQEVAVQLGQARAELHNVELRLPLLEASKVIVVSDRNDAVVQSDQTLLLGRVSLPPCMTARRRQSEPATLPGFARFTPRPYL